MVYSPFSGDANQNNYTTYEYSTSADGPWTWACTIGGESWWRYCAITGLDSTLYWVRVTFTDPDGVGGPYPDPQIRNYWPQLPGNAVTVKPASVTVRNTYLLVKTSIKWDANINSQGIVEVATDPNGPWTVKCARTTFAPKLCRIHGLTPFTPYWIRTTVTDPDGVNGRGVQVLGPFTTRVGNLALGKAITADPGFGCCSDPEQLVDGLIQYPDWPYGFAWCGGTGNWCGTPPGWKQATIDLGSIQIIRRVDWWTHDPHNVPLSWKVEVSSDGLNYTEVFFTNEPRCRTETEVFSVSWNNPSCGHHAQFSPTTARYVRYSFDDSDLFNGVHGWGVELEVFGE
jgi:hypothetical protein